MNPSIPTALPSPDQAIAALREKFKAAAATHACVPIARAEFDAIHAALEARLPAQPIEAPGAGALAAACFQWMQARFDAMTSSASERVMDAFGLEGEAHVSLADLVQRAMPKDSIPPPAHEANDPSRAPARQDTRAFRPIADVDVDQIRSAAGGWAGYEYRLRAALESLLPCGIPMPQVPQGEGAADRLVCPSFIDEAEGSADAASSTAQGAS